MGPFIQQLALAGTGRLYEQSTFVAASETVAVILAPQANKVWVLYELDLSPHDINLAVALTGPNIVNGATVRSLGHPIESAYLATPEAAITAQVQNGTDSAAYVTFRYIEITSLRYREIVNPGYHGENPGWSKAVSQAGKMPSGVSTQRKG